MIWWDNGPGGAGWVVMTVMSLAFWVALIIGGVALWRALTRDHQRGPGFPGDGRTSAQRILDERFARGDIDEEEYARRSAVLRDSR